MADPLIHGDVYDPTMDPKHRPPTEPPVEDPDAARPRDPNDPTLKPGEECPLPPEDKADPDH